MTTKYALWAMIGTKQPSLGTDDEWIKVVSICGWMDAGLVVRSRRKYVQHGCLFLSSMKERKKARMSGTKRLFAFAVQRGFSRLLITLGLEGRSVC